MSADEQQSHSSDTENSNSTNNTANGVDSSKDSSLTSAPHPETQSKDF
jgi:hypothetical protein